MKSGERLRIGSYVLDLADRSLFNDAGGLVHLRPQSADALVVLASRAGQVVTKDALISSVWQDTFVTDASLVQCIKDIRRALGEHDRHLLETVPRRGYRLRTAKVQSTGGNGQFPIVRVEEFARTGDDKQSSAQAIQSGAVSYLSRYPEFVVQTSEGRLEGTNPAVDFVISGSVEVRGSRIRVHVHMADTTATRSIWSDVFEREGYDLFESHDEIARSIAATFGYRLAHISQPLERLGATSVFNLHVPSRSIIMGKTETKLVQGEEMNRNAVKLHPDSALGHIGLAFVYRERFYQSWGPLTPEENLDLAVEEAEKALRLGPLDYYAHLCRGAVHRYQQDIDKAILRYRRALELNPTAPHVHLNLCNCLVSRGDVAEALELISEITEMAPFDAEWRFVCHAVALWANQQYEDALEKMHTMANPSPIFLPYLAVIEASSGEVANAKRTIGNYLERYPEQTVETHRPEVLFQHASLRKRWVEMLKLAGLPSSVVG